MAKPGVRRRPPRRNFVAYHDRDIVYIVSKLHSRRPSNRLTVWRGLCADYGSLGHAFQECLEETGASCPSVLRVVEGLFPRHSDPWDLGKDIFGMLGVALLDLGEEPQHQGAGMLQLNDTDLFWVNRDASSDPEARDRLLVTPGRAMWAFRQVGRQLHEVDLRRLRIIASSDEEEALLARLARWGFPVDAQTDGLFSPSGLEQTYRVVRLAHGERDAGPRHTTASIVALARRGEPMAIKALQLSANMLAVSMNDLLAPVRKKPKEILWGGPLAHAASGHGGGAQVLRGTGFHAPMTHLPMMRTASVALLKRPALIALRGALPRR